MTSASAPVVVAVGDRPEAVLAVTWAAVEARRRGLPLHLVRALDMPPGAYDRPAPEPRRHSDLHASHAVDWPVEAYRDLGHEVPHRTWRERVHTAAEVLVDEARTIALTQAPELEVTSEIPDGTAVDVLAEASRRASLVVMGSRGLSAVTELLATGGIAVPVIARSACPVAVVRGPEAASGDGPVVVGVDGSARAETAVAWAFEDAAARGVPLVAAVVVPESFLPFGGRTAGRSLDAAEESLAESLAGWSEKYPQVRVEREVVLGHPVKVLTALSDGASALVVGTRGLGGFRGMLVGSVSHGLVHRAECPLVVVPTAGTTD